MNSPASSLTSSFSTNIGVSDAERHFLIVNRQYQRSTESSVSPPRVSSVSSTAARTPRANLTGTDLLREQRRWVPHRVSSLKVPRRASSAVAGSTGRGHSIRRSPNGNLTPLPGLTDHTLFEDESVECGLARRYRYSVGESLDHALISINSELNWYVRGLVKCNVPHKSFTCDTPACFIAIFTVKNTFKCTRNTSIFLWTADNESSGHYGFPLNKAGQKLL